MVHTVYRKIILKKKTAFFFQIELLRMPAVDALQFILNLIPFTLV